MPFIVDCPNCNARYRLKDEKKGFRVQCKSCQIVFRAGPKSEKVMLPPQSQPVAAPPGIAPLAATSLEMPSETSVPQEVTSPSTAVSPSPLAAMPAAGIPPLFPMDQTIAPLDQTIAPLGQPQNPLGQVPVPVPVQPAPVASPPVQVNAPVVVPPLDPLGQPVNPVAQPVAPLGQTAAPVVQPLPPPAQPMPPMVPPGPASYPTVPPQQNMAPPVQHPPVSKVGLPAIGLDGRPAKLKKSKTRREKLASSKPVRSSSSSGGYSISSLLQIVVGIAAISIGLIVTIASVQAREGVILYGLIIYGVIQLGYGLMGADED